MDPILRDAVEESQRRPVTEFRNTGRMPRPAGLPRFDSIGPRVKWWREYRDRDRKELAAKVGMSYSGLADLENDRQSGSKFLHLIAAELRLNPHYVESGKGEPEADFAQEAPESENEWPFAEIPLSRYQKLNRIERTYAEQALTKALEEIETERRRNKKQG